MRANVMNPNRYMSTSIWDMSTSIWDTKLQTGGGRGLGYMFFIAHLCNQPFHCQVVVEPGAQICTLLEVWVLAVGMSTFGA
jgi:hypothetical protein